MRTLIQTEFLSVTEPHVCINESFMTFSNITLTKAASKANRKTMSELGNEKTEDLWKKLLGA